MLTGLWVGIQFSLKTPPVCVTGTSKEPSRELVYDNSLYVFCDSGTERGVGGNEVGLELPVFGQRSPSSTLRPKVRPQYQPCYLVNCRYLPHSQLA